MNYASRPMNGTNGSIHHVRRQAHTHHVRHQDPNGRTAQQRVDNNNTSTNSAEGDKEYDELQKIPIMISFRYDDNHAEGPVSKEGTMSQPRTLDLREIVSCEDDHDLGTADFCRQMVEQLASRHWLSSMCRYVYKKEGSEDMNLILHYGSDCHTKILMRKSSSDNTKGNTTPSDKSPKQVNLSIILKMTENGCMCALSPNSLIWDQLSSIDDVESTRPRLQVEVIHDIFIDTSSVSSRVDDKEHVISFNIPTSTPRPSSSKPTPSSSKPTPSKLSQPKDTPAKKKQSSESNESETESVQSESPTTPNPSSKKRKRSTPNRLGSVSTADSLASDETSSRPKSSLERVKSARKQPNSATKSKQKNDSVEKEKDDTLSDVVKPGSVSRDCQYYCMKENETISTIMKKTGCKRMEGISCNSENLEKYGPIIKTKGIRFKKGSMLRIPKRECDVKLLDALRRSTGK